MKMLVIAAHPDDEVLGCGGTIARMAREGHEVHIGIMGEGLTSRFDSREQADPRLVEALHDSSRQAARLLGAQDPVIHNFPDNRFDSVPLLELVKVIEALVEKVPPTVVYTQHGGDLNVDHKAVFAATLTATRPMKNGLVRELYAFEVPSSTEWAFGQWAPDFRPNVFVDIASSLEDKIRALKLYEGETRAFPHPRSPEAVRAIARRWGSVSGLEAAEAF